MNKLWTVLCFNCFEMRGETIAEHSISIASVYSSDIQIAFTLALIKLSSLNENYSIHVRMLYRHRGHPIITRRIQRLHGKAARKVEHRDPKDSEKDCYLRKTCQTLYKPDRPSRALLRRAGSGSQNDTSARAATRNMSRAQSSATMSDAIRRYE